MLLGSLTSEVFYQTSDHRRDLFNFRRAGRGSRSLDQTGFRTDQQLRPAFRARALGNHEKPYSIPARFPCVSFRQIRGDRQAGSTKLVPEDSLGQLSSNRTTSTASLQLRLHASNLRRASNTTPWPYALFPVTSSSIAAAYAPCAGQPFCALPRGRRESESPPCAGNDGTPRYNRPAHGRFRGGLRRPDRRCLRR